MADEFVVIEHADGRRYSVTRETHAKLYPDFAIVGDETPADFEVDVPAPKVKRSHARRKDAAPIADEQEPVE
jgi:hypothetical protein